ncbi:MAG TPA: hypothetical protein VGS27_22290 [Candidatus Sulfotelmatobacter sp.]|nr:hypothetical protein [Candidatus Sulfotelmatobacter sp.]
MSEVSKLAESGKAILGRRAIFILLALSALVFARSVRIQRAPDSPVSPSAQVIHHEHGQSFDDDTGLLWALAPQTSALTPPSPEYRPLRPPTVLLRRFIIRGAHYNRPPPVFS